MDIQEFLLARIAEDERATQAWAEKLTDDLPIPAVLLGGIVDPARVLRECVAKRAIIEQWDDPAFSDQSAYDAGHARAMDDAVRALAAVYSDHPDYQQKWSL